MIKNIDINKNNLDGESSPYLLQHKDNKVNWQPWSDALLKIAEENKKLLIISIGYSSCHWCHVMEHESFNDHDVAELMNTHFIPIKVDREERPDIDQVYMNAAVLMTGQGGWPLNVVALPDGKPVYAGTYFPKEQWMSILKKITELADTHSDALLDVAESVIRGLTGRETESLIHEERTGISEIFKSAGKEILKNMDSKFGGFGGAPKFPLPAALRSLLIYYFYSGDSLYSEAVKLTLDKMSMGGIYDHIGGGFARDSTDREWKVPHFEKMLYDNAQMLSLYSEAYKIFQDDQYKNIVFETADFLLRELFINDKKKGISGFYSSLDADSGGEEGKFYVWDIDEIGHVAGQDFPVVSKYFNITEAGNWEDGKNILYRTTADIPIGKGGYNSVDTLAEVIENFKRRLLEVREKREKPSLDNKIVAAWNSLTVSGLIDAYSAFNEEKFIKTAEACLIFMEHNMISEEGRILRIFNAETMTASINGFLDDYAFTIESLLKLYQVTFEERWVVLAEKLLMYAMDHFFNEEKSMFFFKSDIDRELIVRNYEIQDNVIPSSNAVMAFNLFLIGEILQNKSYLDMSEKMVGSIAGNLMNGREYFAKWCSLLGNQVYKSVEIVITGKDALTFRDELDRNFIPNAVYFGGEKGGTFPLIADKTDFSKTFIYVCHDKKCLVPVTDVKSALDLIKSLKSGWTLTIQR